MDKKNIRELLVRLAAGAATVDEVMEELREEPFGCGELPRIDELFFADHRGVTSLSRCDGLPLMTFVAERIAEAMEGLFQKK